jgi:hypothetical protein
VDSGAGFGVVEFGDLGGVLLGGLRPHRTPADEQLGDFARTYLVPVVAGSNAVSG